MASSSTSRMRKESIESVGGGLAAETDESMSLGASSNDEDSNGGGMWG